MAEGGTILIAEDDVKLQSLVRRSFERAGFAVIQAFTGAEFTQALTQIVPDLIVLDVALPDADGRDLLATLKKDPKTAPIPVVVWSGRDSESDRRIAIALGAEDYVEKGPPSTLVSKVERLLLRLREQ